MKFIVSDTEAAMQVVADWRSQLKSQLDDTLYVCARCGSPEIQDLWWVGTNDNILVGPDYGDDVYCPRCEVLVGDGNQDAMLTRLTWKAEVRGKNCGCGDEERLPITGWDHAFSEGHDAFEIQRCDSCKKFGDDDEARLAHDAECGCDYVNTGKAG
jgi:hypothetical protein